MPNDFQFDVFLSHSAKDKAVVRPLAERLRADGLKVWFDEWVLKPGDNIPAKIEEGLEHSRVLVLCMSAQAFGSDWAQLEAGTFRFRDPLNRERRFIPLRLDDAKISDTLKQFDYVDWRIRTPVGYRNLFVACRPDDRAAAKSSLQKNHLISETLVLAGHTNEIRTAVITRDGKKVISGSVDHSIKVWDLKTGQCLATFEGHSDAVQCLALTPDGKTVVSGAGCVMYRSDDNTLKVWDLASGMCQRTLEGHTGPVDLVIVTPDGINIVSGSRDHTMRVWDVRTGKCLMRFEGHAGPIDALLLSPDGKKVISGSRDGTVKVWGLRPLRPECLLTFEGHPNGVCSLVITPDGKTIVSGDGDVVDYSKGGSLRIWDLDSGRCRATCEGHAGHIRALALLKTSGKIVSGSEDTTLKVWDVNFGRCVATLEGHTDTVTAAIPLADDRWVISSSDDSTLRVWDVDLGECVVTINGPPFEGGSFFRMEAVTPDRKRAITISEDDILRVWSIPEVASLRREFVSSRYTNAKVLLVGESGVGKTGLSKRLVHGIWEPSDSTVGAWVTQWKLPVSSDSTKATSDKSGGGVEREIWLWDFGGQADQRLIHQLFMDDTSLAVFVFDGQKEDIFDTLVQWDRDLARASRKEFVKLLVAGRVDAGGLRASRSEVEKFAAEHKFRSFLETSAKQNTGCEELKRAILDGIRWEDIPWRSSPVLFKRLKKEIIRLKDEGRVLIRFNELRETLQMRLSGEFKRFADEELRAVLTLLAGPGVVWELAFGSWVLLQPERINAYAQAVIRTLQADEHQRGCLMEERVLKGDLAYESSMPRLADDEERFVLLAMHQTLVERGLCLRQPTDKGNLLVFPSYYRRERPDIVQHPAVLVNYRFTGFLDEIYATLVVRLHHTEPFQQDQLWRYAADFKTNTGKQLGVKLTRRAPGVGELEVYFDPAVAMEEKIIFSKYVHEHLLQHARDVERLRHYVCPQCGTPVGNREVAMKRLNDWLQGRPPQPEAGSRFKFRKDKEEPPSIICVGCEERVPLWDEMEQCFASPEIQQQVRDLQEESAIVLSNQSKERALVGEVISTVALADQISREFNVSDQGIDLEIEFTDDAHEATGAKLYLQLKSGDSYLRERKGDGAEIFTIKEERHAPYWMAQAFPVLLVIRNAEGEVRWMEVRDWLKRASDNGRKPVKQIVFAGERFDVMSVRRWRERVLGRQIS